MRLYDNYVDYEDYIRILQLFSEFDYCETNEKFIFQYKTHDIQLLKLLEQFDYPHQIIDGKEFRSMVQLMIWVFEHLIGDGMCIPPANLNAAYILKMTKTKQIKSNCFMYAVVLNEIFLSMGIKSRMVRCMPMDLVYNDCHCVTEAYCEEYDKWIVFDAANKAYYVDEHMKPLNLFEIRENILNRRPLVVPMMKRSLSSKLFQYLAKNLVRFESDRISQYNAETQEGERSIFHFQSTNFPIWDKTVEFPERNLTLHHLHTSNPDLFWAKPDALIG